MHKRKQLLQEKSTWVNNVFLYLPSADTDQSMRYTSFRQTSFWAESSLISETYERNMKHRVEAHGKADSL